MLLKLKNISKSYQNRFGKTTREVLKSIDLELDSGEKIAIVGPSGSGKTTLLNIAGTLDTPGGGSISFDGVSLTDMDSHDLASFRNKQVGFVFQLHHLLPQCTLWENVLIPTLPLKNKSKQNYERAEQLMKETGIWEMRYQKPPELSGGECQRTAVVRALINKPGLLLADEPTGSLDEKNAGILMDLLIKLNEQENTGMIVVTHSMEIAKRMDKVYSLKEGKLATVSP